MAKHQNDQTTKIPAAKNKQITEQPHHKVVHVTGNIIVAGTVPAGGAQVSGRIKVGYFTYLEDENGNVTEEKFVPVVVKAVSGTAEEGFVSERGQTVPFDVWISPAGPNSVWRTPEHYEVRDCDETNTLAKGFFLTTTVDLDDDDNDNLVLGN